MSTTANGNGVAPELDAARTKLFADMRIDVLTAAQETDNEAARREVSRTFTCKSHSYSH